MRMGGGTFGTLRFGLGPLTDEQIKTGQGYASGMPVRDVPVGMIYRIKQPNWPQFVFEWHPVVEKLFIRRLQVDGKNFELVASNIKTDGDAQNATLVWLRGYRTRDQERERNPALKAEDY